MLPGSPLIWLSAVLAVANVVTYGVTKYNAGRQLAVAYADGMKAGRGEAATTTLVEASKTAEARREAEAETPLPIDKQAINELCRRRPKSCREAPRLR